MPSTSQTTNREGKPSAKKVWNKPARQSRREDHFSKKREKWGTPILFRSTFKDKDGWTTRRLSLRGSFCLRAEG